VERTVALMELLAARPADDFSLSELARDLDINKATIHSMLTTLVDVGWVTRGTEKRYRVGPAIHAMAGRALDRRALAVELAADHLRSLAAEFGVTSVLSGLVDDEMIVLAVEGDPGSRTLAEVGLRLPLELPLGALFLAWDDHAADAMLRHDLPDGPMAARYRDVLQRVRACGWALMPQVPGRRQMIELLRELSLGMPRPRTRHTLQQLLAELEHEEVELVITEIDPDRRYDGGFLGAPVFDQDGRVLVTLGVLDLDTDVGGAEVAARAEQLRSSAAEITAAIGGHPPDATTPGDGA
jgi:DNA-binding IclR family transcriptional regulator